MATMLYTVLAASGGWVAGQEVAIGSQIALTDVEARYELDLGTIAPTGQEPPQPPPPPALLDGDLIETRRGSLDRAIVIAALEVFLTRVGGGIAQYVDARDAALVASLSAQGATLAGLRAALVGTADAQHDTLGKLQTALAGLSATLADKAAASELAALDARTNHLDNTSDATKAQPGNPIGDAIAAAALKGRLLAKTTAPALGDLADGQWSLICDTSTTPPTFVLAARVGGALSTFVLNPPAA
ncbi:hypothetical protein [Methylobacterium nodulans]|uniref:Uncharacterized protein n=1 Tax=Methylobacterium nodulans (strain LMG 21967 / CNCM I-2342 / ORS 2060) TaxID=460265 RepID=B8IDN4_METNO|nr:hypothetical protein [Methylobacterium nodulans]ACL55606.1 hypothetical protein Mnod_0569 [Methylobacterium nodulans ORS 2060]